MLLQNQLPHAQTTLALRSCSPCAKALYLQVCCEDGVPHSKSSCKRTGPKHWGGMARNESYFSTPNGNYIGGCNNPFSCRGFISCPRIFHLTTMQVQGLAVDVFVASWETVWVMTLFIILVSMHPSHSVSFGSGCLFHQHVTPERFLMDVLSLSLTTCHGVMNPVVGTKKLTYEMLFGMLGDRKGYPYLKVGELSCPKRFHPLKPNGGGAVWVFFLGRSTKVWPKWLHACEGVHWGMKLRRRWLEGEMENQLVLTH